MPTRLLTDTFNRFFESEKAGGLLLLIATAISVAITNSALGPQYLGFWQTEFAGYCCSV
jgi:NhaA family Na+:H+ antiporter